MTRMLADVTEMSRSRREGPDRIAGTPRRFWTSRAPRRVARALLLALSVVMASACVVPWSVERDEPGPNSPPIFDEDAVFPSFGKLVPQTATSVFVPQVAARDADLGDVLTARLFAEIPGNDFYYFGQEFRLTLPALPDPEHPQRRTGSPTAQLSYCPAFGSTTVRVIVTDGTFSNQPGEQHKATGGDTISNSWRLQCSGM
jgi:hypothetical protein